MENRKKITVLLLLLSVAFSLAVAHQSDESSAEATETNLDNQESSHAPQTAQRRHGIFPSGSALHYHQPATTGYAYAAKSYYTPVVKYPVYKTYATAAAATPLHQHVHAYARPQYSLQHGGASVSSYNVNYPRYPLHRPVLRAVVPQYHYPSTYLKPTVHSAPGFFAPAPIAPVAPIIPQKPIIPIAFNPVLPTAARPIVYPQQAVFNPSILAGLNPQLIPVSVSNGAVFANYPSLAPTPIAPSSWKPIAAPTFPTTIVQRPSISILPPLGAPSATVATFADHISFNGQQHHHQFAQHVPSTAVTVSSASTPVLSDSHDHHQQQHFLPSGTNDCVCRSFSQIE